jgi:hypothetical protein
MRTADEMTKRLYEQEQLVVLQRADAVALWSVALDAALDAALEAAFKGITPAYFVSVSSDQIDVAGLSRSSVRMVAEKVSASYTALGFTPDILAEGGRFTITLQW